MANKGFGKQKIILPTRPNKISLRTEDYYFYELERDHLSRIQSMEIKEYPVINIHHLNIKKEVLGQFLSTTNIHWFVSQEICQFTKHDYYCPKA